MLKGKQNSYINESHHVFDNQGVYTATTIRTTTTRTSKNKRFYNKDKEFLFRPLSILNVVSNNLTPVKFSTRKK